MSVYQYINDLENDPNRDYLNEDISITATTNNKCQIERLGDIMRLDKIILPQSAHLENITSLRIMIGGATVWNIPFGLLLSLTTTETNDANDVKIINIPRNLFTSDIICKYGKSYDYIRGHKQWIGFLQVALQYHKIEITLNTNSANSYQYQLVLDTLYYKRNLRRMFAQMGHEFDITQYTTISLVNVVTTRLVIHQGYNYVVLRTVEPLEQLSIKFDGESRCDMDSEKVATLCHNTKSCYYYKIPCFMPDQTFEETWDQLKIFVIDFNFSSNISCDLIIVYNNYFRVVSGMGGACLTHQHGIVI
jgi:hypothetical protein